MVFGEPLGQPADPRALPSCPRSFKITSLGEDPHQRASITYTNNGLSEILTLEAFYVVSTRNMFFDVYLKVQDFFSGFLTSLIIKVFKKVCHTSKKF